MIKVTRKTPESYRGDMVVFFDTEEPGTGAELPAGLRQRLERARKVGDFKGKEGETLLLYPEADWGFTADRILVVGLGKPVAGDGEAGIRRRESLRKAGGTSSATALKLKVQQLFVALPTGTVLPADEEAEALVEGLVLGSYRFDRYKSAEKDNDRPRKIKEIALWAGTTSVRRGVNRGRVAAEAACAARDMANEPANKWTVVSFARYGEQLAERYGLSCRVFAVAELAGLGMGGIIGVGSGSADTPRLVAVEYITDRKAPTLLLVGKGITFDSGGICIKPSAGMEEMKYDMCGGAAVLAAMQAVAEERPVGLNVVALVPAAENLPGPAALKPGDVIHLYGGKTVEVVNTDAEGRLILADALAFGIDKYKPVAVVDIATLTGAVVVALGHHRTGLFANDDTLAERLKKAGDRSGELLWQLPLGEEYTKMLKSEVADLKNIGDRSAGSITAAAFLQEFVGEVPWAHLDIAGTAWNYTEKSYVPKGPSGNGVRTLVELVRGW